MTAKQIDRILDIFDRAVKVAERWSDVEYPPIDETQETFISRAGGRALPNSEDEKATVEEEMGRFEKRLRNQA